MSIKSLWAKRISVNEFHGYFSTHINNSRTLNKMKSYLIWRNDKCRHGYRKVTLYTLPLCIFWTASTKRSVNNQLTHLLDSLFCYATLIRLLGLCAWKGNSVMSTTRIFSPVVKHGWRRNGGKTENTSIIPLRVSALINLAWFVRAKTCLVFGLF